MIFSAECAHILDKNIDYHSLTNFIEIKDTLQIL